MGQGEEHLDQSTAENIQRLAQAAQVATNVQKVAAKGAQVAQTSTSKGKNK